MERPGPAWKGHHEVRLAFLCHLPIAPVRGSPAARPVRGEDMHRDVPHLGPDPRQFVGPAAVAVNDFREDPLEMKVGHLGDKEIAIIEIPAAADEDACHVRNRAAAVTRYAWMAIARAAASS